MLRQAQQAGFQLIELVEMRRFILQYNFEQLLMFLLVLSLFLRLIQWLLLAFVQGLLIIVMESYFGSLFWH